MTADIDREKLRELCERASPGPWNLGRGPKTLFVDGPSTNPSIPSPDVVCTSELSDRSIEQDNDNMRFIAVSRTALPALLDLTDAQAAKIVELEEMIEASDAVTGDQDSALMDSYKYEEALRAQITELEVALAKAENILARNLGRQTEKCFDALEIIRNALFPGLKPVFPTKLAELEAKVASLESERDQLRKQGEGRADWMRKAETDVIAERRRQIEQEGWTPEHDARHAAGDLADAAACYASTDRDLRHGVPFSWPWSAAWWKPTDRRRDLVKAGALIIAEIERLDRARELSAVSALEQKEQG